MTLNEREALALRSLRDCTKVRAAWWHLGFAGLRKRGLVFTVPVPGTDRLDFTLSATGADRAKVLFGA